MSPRAESPAKGGEAGSPGGKGSDATAKGGQLDKSKGAPSMRRFVKEQVSLRAWVPSQSVELMNAT